MSDLHKIENALRHGIIVDARGAPVEQSANALMKRVEGTEKLTGSARYAGEVMPEGCTYALFVGATIAQGELLAVRSEKALAVPGAIAVLTAEDMPAFNPPVSPPFGQSHVPMSSHEILYEGQPVAIVVAETLEAAEEAAALVELDQRSNAPFLQFDDAEPVKPSFESFQKNDVERGDVEVGLTKAAAVVEQTYDTPSHHHNAMESPTSIAEWRGDKLHIWDSTQWGFGIRYVLNTITGIPVDDITVTCPHTGGAFGSKGFVWPHQVLTPIAARIIGRPVKLSLRRDGAFTGHGYQPAMHNKIRIGADKDGKLTAFEHISENVTSTFDEYFEYGSSASRAAYTVENFRFHTRIRQVPVATPTPMRAPHEGPGSFATESAMDELAFELGIDPLEFRLRNYAETDLLTGKPFSSKKLREAYAEGARRIGWDQRALQPRMRRDGDKLIGLGMATSVMTTFRHRSAARVRVGSNGAVVVEAGNHEVGSGVRTMLATVAAEQLGVAADQVRVEIGSTDLIETAGVFGSGTTVGAGSAVADAIGKLKDQVSELAGAEVPQTLDAWLPVLNNNGVAELEADGSYGPREGFDAHGDLSDHSMFSYGAIFVEMEVDEMLGLGRMLRAVGCYSAGRIINPIAARSQMIGSIIWGYGRAMLQASPMDPGSGRFLSKNLSGVLVPVNADIPVDVDISFVDEHDPHCSLLGVRGIGELGEVGVAAAITNAIHNATGKRIRRAPVQIEDLMS